MARNHIRKIIVTVLMELIIPILFEVQATGMSFSLYPSSLPISIPNPSQFDKVHGPLYIYLEFKSGVCKKKYRPESKDFGKCIIKSLVRCMSKHRKYLKRADIEIYLLAEWCLESSFQIAKVVDHHMANYLLHCYEEHIREYYDVVYVWIP